MLSASFSLIYVPIEKFHFIIFCQTNAKYQNYKFLFPNRKILLQYNHNYLLGFRKTLPTIGKIYLFSLNSLLYYPINSLLLFLYLFIKYSLLVGCGFDCISYFILLS